MSSQATRQLRPRSERAIVAVLLVVHGLMLAWGQSRHSPVWNEPAHLVAGISHWQLGTFDLYRVNPPLVRMVGSAAALLAQPETDWSRYDAGVGVRSERAVAEDFLRLNGEGIGWLVTVARWACLPFSLLGAYVCFRWARELFGQLAGVLALALWCFSPNILAHGQLITPDVAAAALGVAAAYVFWRWLKEPRWPRTLVAGAVLGLAELAKATWIVLFPLWPVLWLIRSRAERRSVIGETWFGEMRQLIVILVLGLYVLNMGYGFEGSFRKLGDYRFVSQTLAGTKSSAPPHAEGRNRFAGTCLGRIPVPLPSNYVMGIDIQKSDFENKMWSYLRGEYRFGGWWYYYLYALAIKVPLGTWILLLLAIGLSVSTRRYMVGWWNELALLLPIVIILGLVSSQTGLNRHLRYVLSIFPFAFISISRLGRAFEFDHRAIMGIGLMAVICTVGSSLWIYPHSLSYFSEVVGGPMKGYNHLGAVEADSSIDWGQDLFYLRRWQKKRGKSGRLCLAFNGGYDADILGIPGLLPPIDPQPGWYALSVTKMRREYQYFQRLEPVAMAGYSIYIYHVTPRDANRVRRDLGLPELPARETGDGIGGHSKTTVELEASYLCNPLRECK